MLFHRRKRDKSNVLLSANLDKLVQEQCKTNSRMDQVNSHLKGFLGLMTMTITTERAALFFLLTMSERAALIHHHQQ